LFSLIIPFTPKVKGYIVFEERHVKGGRKRLRPNEVYTFLISITSAVDLAITVCPSERCALRNFKS